MRLEQGRAIAESCRPCVIGDAEVTNGTVTLEHRTKGKIGEIKLDALVALLEEEIKTKAL
jgi:threonyl-tRNA synthetase